MENDKLFKIENLVLHYILTNVQRMSRFGAHICYNEVWP